MARKNFTPEQIINKLRKSGISFMSITEQMDFTTPWGKFTLSMLGGLAELYSDNLSLETKKGWNERRKQGLYCAFHIPEDCQKRILSEQKKLQAAYDIDRQRKGLEVQLSKLVELYKWGHKTRSEYLADYNAIKR